MADTTTRSADTTTRNRLGPPSGSGEEDAMMVVCVCALVGLAVGAVLGGAPFGPIGSIAGAVIGLIFGLAFAISLELFIRREERRAMHGEPH